MAIFNHFNWFRRVEPGVKFSCEMDYDPFRLMQERDLKYGFTIALREYRATIPTLWKTTLEYAKSHPQFIYPRKRPDSLLRLISDDNGWSYNLCHFWSNFEVRSFSAPHCYPARILRTIFNSFIIYIRLPL